MANLIIPRDSTSAVGFCEKIYVFGGYNNNSSLNSIERYDKSTQQ
jgi:Kelch motif.